MKVAPGQRNLQDVSNFDGLFPPSLSPRYATRPLLIPLIGGADAPAQHLAATEGGGTMKRGGAPLDAPFGHVYRQRQGGDVPTVHRHCAVDAIDDMTQSA
jgi:hypothetical protein